MNSVQNENPFDEEEIEPDEMEPSRKANSMFLSPAKIEQSIVEIARASSPSSNKRKSQRSSIMSKQPVQQSNSTLNGLRSRQLREKSGVARVSNHWLKRARQQCHGKQKLLSLYNYTAVFSSIICWDQ
jgi:hypothetical protein